MERSLEQLLHSYPSVLWVLFVFFLLGMFWLVYEALKLNSLKKRIITWLESHPSKRVSPFSKLLCACVLVLATIRQAKAQFPVELACPANYTVSQNGRSFDSTTNSWRFFQCEVPLTGVMLWNDAVSTSVSGVSFSNITSGLNPLNSSSSPALMTVGSN